MQYTRKTRIEFRFPRTGWYRSWADYDYDHDHCCWYAASTSNNWFREFGNDFDPIMTDQAMLLVLLKYSNNVDQK